MEMCMVLCTHNVYPPQGDAAATASGPVCRVMSYNILGDSLVRILLL